MKTVNQRRYISTIKLVGRLHAEPREVKQSVGGTRLFRSVMDFVLSNTRYQDDEKMEVVTRKASEIAGMLQNNFSKEDLNEIKSLYN